MTESKGFDDFTATTGGEEEGYILEQRDAFFVGIIEELKLGELAPFVSIESHLLGLANNFLDQYLTEDVVHELLFRDIVLGLVLDRRNDFNNHSVTFHKSVLSEQQHAIIAKVRELASSLEDEPELS